MSLQIRGEAIDFALKRFMRPDAARYLRPDWKRFWRTGRVRDPLFAYYDWCERKYRPDQARVPAGVPEGGQWTDEGAVRRGQGGRATGETTELSGQRRVGRGHHEVPRAAYSKLPLPKETRAIFEDAVTGRIPVRGHYWDDTHREYNRAVEGSLNEFMTKHGISPERMTPEQAQSFLQSVRNSTDPRIGGYNKRIRMLQFLYRLRTGTLRGNE